MEFLVRTEITPPDLPDDKLASLYDSERDRARELAEAGTLLRLWRIPGRRANYGLWSAPHATALHDALTSLPLWPYMDIEVHPLAAHPNDPSPISLE
ncbi:MAG: muconolactone delta-isomerase [Micromonosporaceae bacterium]|nr:muconolactone delta-isomerase [Micromonosporaceae bacterium]